MTDTPWETAIAAMNQRIDTAVELEQNMAGCRLTTPEILNGLAQNCDWLLRRCLQDLELVDEDDDEDDTDALQLSAASTRKLVPCLATMAKGLREFSEFLTGLDAFRAENAA